MAGLYRPYCVGRTFLSFRGKGVCRVCPAFRLQLLYSVRQPAVAWTRFPSAFLLAVGVAVFYRQLERIVLYCRGAGALFTGGVHLAAGVPSAWQVDICLGLRVTRSAVAALLCCTCRPWFNFHDTCPADG